MLQIIDQALPIVTGLAILYVGYKGSAYLAAFSNVLEAFDIYIELH